jgi:hypothetical protein
MDEQDVRDRAAAVCAALVAGDVDGAIGAFSEELRRNLGEVLTLFPLPATDATIESVERGGSGFIVVLRLVGETDEVTLQTRWKERDGRATLIEASHLSSTERASLGDEAGVDGAEDESGTVTAG